MGQLLNASSAMDWTMSGIRISSIELHPLKALFSIAMGEPLKVRDFAAEQLRKASEWM